MENFNDSFTENDLSWGKKGRFMTVWKGRQYDKKERAIAVAFWELSSQNSKNLLQDKVHHFRRDLAVFHNVFRQVNFRKLCCYKQDTEQEKEKALSPILAFHIYTN